ncbi:MAG: DoxX family protein [Rubrobacteraceae bacterium]|nr:DoxX family membrane protein [Rubrobacter sp.]
MNSSLSRILLGATFVVAGSLHFRFPGVYERIMPSYLPFHRGLVYLSGAAEVLGGLGLLPERTRRVSGFLLVLLLLAVCLANLQMLLDARAAGKPRWWTVLLWLRLPLQVPLMLWAWRASRQRS